MGSIDIREDFDSLPGNALVTVDVPVPNPLSVGLRVKRRAQKDPYLGNAGWQAQEATLKLEFVATDGPRTIFRLPPPAADHVPQRQPVEVELVGINLRQSMQWPYITPSGGQSVAIEAPKTVLPPVPPPPPPPPPTPTPTPAPTQPPTPPPTQAPRPTPPPTQLQGSSPKTRSRAPWLSLLVFLALAAGGAYYLFGPAPAPEPDQPAPPPPAGQPAPAGRSIAERLEELRKTDFTGDKLFALSEEAYAAGDRDNGYLALLIASKTLQYGPARLLEGKLYDPMTFEPGRGPAVADPNTAAYYYKVVAEGGDAEAKDLLRRLCDEAGKPDSPHANALQALRRADFCG